MNRQERRNVSRQFHKVGETINKLTPEQTMLVDEITKERAIKLNNEYWC